MEHRLVLQSDYMKLAVFAFETRNLDTFPSIVNALRLLVREGHSVDIFLPSSMSSDITIEGCQIFIVSDPERYEYVTHATAFVAELGAKYDYIFAYYIEGLIAAEMITRNATARVPIIYMSMELIYKDYPYRLVNNIINPLKLPAETVKSLVRAAREKNLSVHRVCGLLSAYCKEIIYSMLAWKSWIHLRFTGKARIAFSVVSDYMRAKALKEELLFVDKIIYAPEAGYIGYDDRKSDYAFKQFGISPHKKILLYSGGLENGFDVSLLEITRVLGDEYILFCNVYSRDGYVHKLIPQFSDELSNGKIFFQADNLNEHDYDELVRSAHIGIVWYPMPDPHNPNMYFLGFSSGKLNKFLSCSKPVICSGGIYGYSEMIEGNGLGRICKKAAEFPAALCDIDANYQQMIPQIKSFYLGHIEFEAHFRNILNEICSHQLPCEFKESFCGKQC
jgi:glycosyltransferase involved in cell wall biosynthesis